MFVTLKTQSKMRKNLLLITLLLLSQFAFTQRTLIYCGSLFDMTNSSARQNVTIIVEKNKITAVQNGFTAAQTNDKIIDLKNKYVMPGLIDMHVHIEGETNRELYLKKYQSREADIAFEAHKAAQTTLMAGFTTVRELGGSGVNISIRNAINKGIVTGPRIITAGKIISTTGGHGDPTSGLSPIYTPTDERFMDGVIDSYDEARKAVRQRYKDGSDFIKITATGGVTSVTKNGKAPHFMDDELHGVVETAKDYGFHVAAHAHGAEGMKRALRAGVTTIEHGTLLDDECIALFKEKGAYLVPTITAGKMVSDSAKIRGYYPAIVAAKAIEVGEQIQKAFARAYKAGVKIAFGTDAAVFPHGYNAKEFQYMTEVGMPMIEALQCATVVNAKVLDMSEQIGTIEVNKLADIIAVDNNPITDPKVMMSVTFVMKDGVVYKMKM
jgi:imidazolonepropionase-like amidohydrolase